MVEHLLRVIESTAEAAAFVRFASSKTISGDLPPSSRATSLRFDRAAACMIARPALVEPVKLILLMTILDSVKDALR